jgi:hypothetical protein
MEVGFLVKALVAAFETAQERFLTGVNPEMGLQVKVERELFAAELALVRFFSLNL